MWAEHLEKQVTLAGCRSLAASGLHKRSCPSLAWRVFTSLGSCRALSLLLLL